VIHQRSGDVYDASGLVLQHLLDCKLRDIKEAGQGGGDKTVEVIWGVLGEWLGYEDARVVDQDIDGAEPRNRGGSDLLRCFEISDVAVNDRHIG